MDLSQLMADAARELQERADATGTMNRAVELAVSEVEASDAASISTAQRRGRVQTPVASHASARHADSLQYAAGQGPCLDALWTEELVEVPDLATDGRWPEWSAQMVAESGYRSMLVVRLYTRQDVVGALNLYAARPRAFAAADREIATVLAAHIAVSVRDTQEIEQLSTALDARTVIGQAQGIAMERFGLDEAAAFALLTRLSTHTNRKLREIAVEVVATGALPSVP